MRILLLVLFFGAVLLEASVVSFPLSLLFLILAACFSEGFFVLFLSGGAGLLMDVFLLRPLGLTAGVYLLAVFLVRLYQRKLETRRLRFLAPFAGLMIGVYSWYFYGRWKEYVLWALAGAGLARLLAAWVAKRGENGVFDRSVRKIVG